MGAEPHALHGPGLLYVRLEAAQTGLYVMEVRAENGERWTSTVLVERD